MSGFDSRLWILPTAKPFDQLQLYMVQTTADFAARACVPRSRVGIERVWGIGGAGPYPLLIDIKLARTQRTHVLVVDSERIRLPVIEGDEASCENPHCMGHYDFASIARFATQRFVKGVQTVELLQRATSLREREEIALVAILDVRDDIVHDMRLDCSHADKCKTTDCRERLKVLIEDELTDK